MPHVILTPSTHPSRTEAAGGNQPVNAVDTSRRERKSRAYLTPEEYNKLLAAAGANLRDFCILTLFNQTGIRISELCDLRLGDIVLDAGTLTVRVGKGMAARSIEMEEKGIRATTTWLQVQPSTSYDHLFLDRDEEPLKELGYGICCTNIVNRRVSPSA